MDFLTKLFVKKRPADKEILNKGFSMAMEFGPNWLQPVNERLKLRFSFLSNEEIEQYNKVCVAAMKAGHEFILNTLSLKADRNETVNSTEFKKQFKKYFTEKFIWANQSNINHIYSQGLYYAWKEGLDKVLT